MGIELVTNLVQDTFLNTNILGLEWLIMLCIIGMTLFLITRDLSAWKHLIFPVSIGWFISGLKSGTIFDGILLTAAGISFIIETLSVSTAGRILETVKERSIDAITRTRKSTRDLIKETRLSAQRETYGKVLKGSIGDQLKEDMRKAAGKVYGQSFLNRKEERERVMQTLQGMQIKDIDKANAEERERMRIARMLQLEKDIKNNKLISNTKRREKERELWELKQTQGRLINEKYRKINNEGFIPTIGNARNRAIKEAKEESLRQMRINKSIMEEATRARQIIKRGYDTKQREMFELSREKAPQIARRLAKRFISNRSENKDYNSVFTRGLEESKKVVNQAQMYNIGKQIRELSGYIKYAKRKPRKKIMKVE